MGAHPARFTPVKSEPLVRLLIADLAGEAPTRESVRALRSEIDELLTWVAEAEVSAELLPHRAKYLLLTTGFLRRLLDLYLELVYEVERELAPNRRGTPRQSKRPAPHRRPMNT